MPNLQKHPNPSGAAQTFSKNGGVDLGNEFFQSIGSNGRSCSSCHDAAAGWTLTPTVVQERFAATGGTDPVFRPNDGAVCPTADVSTPSARQSAYKMLLTRGLIRVSIPIPAGAEFQLIGVDDPYGCANATDMALFRRPLPATNLPFLSTVMWDGRESPKGRSLHDNLISQATDATLGHAQAAAAPTTKQLEDIVAFEMALYTAQIRDNNAGDLSDDGAKGGATRLSKQEFYLGINDPLGQNPTGAAFDPTVFRLYEKWAYDDSELREARRSIARGEQIFNTHPILIQGVSGLNDELGVEAINGTCTTCHDAPNVGNHSMPAPLNLGVADESLRTPDMPLYTLQCIATGQIFKVTDPGRALITGKCKDIGRFKGPVLRGLASRAPYFHNGMAATLEDAVDFYDRRFNIGFSDQEKKDLVAFLKTL